MLADGDDPWENHCRSYSVSAYFSNHLLVWDGLILWPHLRRVLSKQPDVQQQDFPGPQWDSPLVAIFGFDFGWIVPVCTIDYFQQ